MSYYESVLITRQELGDKEIKKIIDNLTNVLKKNKAIVVSTELWGLRPLAYKIAKNKKGHYVMLQIVGDGESIKELERNMRIDENIIRYLSLKIDNVSEKPSIMIKKTFESSKEEVKVNKWICSREINIIKKIRGAHSGEKEI